jgi:hypothetical protein
MYCRIIQPPPTEEEEATKLPLDDEDDDDDDGKRRPPHEPKHKPRNQRITFSGAAGFLADLFGCYG